MGSEQSVTSVAGGNHSEQSVTSVAGGNHSEQSVTSSNDRSATSVASDASNIKSGPSVPRIDDNIAEDYEIINPRTYVDAVLNRAHMDVGHILADECHEPLPPNYTDAQKIRENLQCVCRRQIDQIICTDQQGYIDLHRDIPAIEQVIRDAQEIAAQNEGRTLSYYLCNIWLPEIATWLDKAKRATHQSTHGTVKILADLGKLKPVFIEDGNDFSIRVGHRLIRPAYRNMKDSTKIIDYQVLAK